MAENNIRAIFVSQSGLGVGGRIYWKSTVSPTEITYDDVYAAQAAAGKHPLGYSLFGFVCKQAEGGYEATWNCSASCD